MKELVIEKDKVVHNIQVIQKKAQGASLIAVLKANAYGLGLCQMAEVLREQGVKRFGVTEPVDAVQLRNAGFMEEEIIMLRSTFTLSPTFSKPMLERSIVSFMAVTVYVPSCKLTTVRHTPL